jgi:hypothetical protein
MSRQRNLSAAAKPTKIVIWLTNMLIHIVCWKYKADTSGEMRDDHRARLRALKPLMSEIISFNVGADILHLDRSFDSGLVAVFPDRKALDSYTDHPAHQRVAAFGRHIAERVVSVDFET